MSWFLNRILLALNGVIVALIIYLALWNFSPAWWQIMRMIEHPGPKLVELFRAQYADEIVFRWLTILLLIIVCLVVEFMRDRLDMRHYNFQPTQESIHAPSRLD